MHQLILGSDIIARDKVLRGLKARFLKTPDALKLDFTGLDAASLDYNDLKTALLTVPAVAPRRIILVSRAQKLDDQQLQLIDHVIGLKEQACVIVLEAVVWDKRNSWRKRIAEKVQVTGAEEPETAFNILDDLPHDKAGVVLRLQTLFERDAPENILGAARWWWTHKAKSSVPAVRYKKGLLVIQEADERIKLSHLLSREQAVEVALVKLSSLIKA